MSGCVVIAQQLILFIIHSIYYIGTFGVVPARVGTRRLVGRNNDSAAAHPLRDDNSNNIIKIFAERVIITGLRKTRRVIVGS